MTRPLLVVPALLAIAAPARVPTTLVALPRPQPAVPVRYDFGTLDPATRPQVSHVFVLRNAGPTPLTLGELDTSCRCTTATVDTPDGEMPLTLAPGGQAAVRVSITFDSLRPGPLTKDVWVYLRGHPRPLADLELAGVLRPAKIGKRVP